MDILTCFFSQLLVVTWRTGLFQSSKLAWQTRWRSLIWSGECPHVNCSPQSLQHRSCWINIRTFNWPFQNISFRLIEEFAARCTTYDSSHTHIWYFGYFGCLHNSQFITPSVMESWSILVQMEKNYILNVIHLVFGVIFGGWPILMKWFQVSSSCRQVFWIWISCI